jgi:hypothetical protein
MTEFLQLLLIGCLWIWGVNYLFKKGEILGFIGEYLRARVSKWILKPLFNCPACQSSLHGTLIYFISGIGPLYLWPVFCICLVGINHIIIEHLYDTTIQD